MRVFKRNRKVMASILAVSMLFGGISNYAVNAYSQNAVLAEADLAAEITINNASVTEQALTYDLTLSQNGVLITLVYDNSEKLIKMEIDEVTSGTKQKSIALDGSVKSGTTKFMLWNNLNDISPVSEFVNNEWKIPTVVKVMPLGDSITDGFNIAGGYRNTLESKI